jgi:hypothetical protein
MGFYLAYVIETLYAVEAIGYREPQDNISFKVIEPKKKEFVIKSYADNFLKN